MREYPLESDNTINLIALRKHWPLTRVHNFRNRFKIQKRINGQHESVFNWSHNITDSLFTHFQNPRDDVDLILVQVVVVFRYFHQFIKSL